MPASPAWRCWNFWGTAPTGPGDRRTSTAAAVPGVVSHTSGAYQPPAAQNQYGGGYGNGSYNSGASNSGAAVYRDDRPHTAANPAAIPAAGPAEPPVPGSMPDYLQGNDAPQNGGSRWTRP